ncbi:histidine phosphatase family protein, partial [Cutibacterium granulosum]
QGQTMHVPLTDLGRAQAEQAARRVVELVAPGTAVISSDQLRAVQTAEPIARALGVAVTTDARLREQALGRMEGKLPEELTPEPAPPGIDVADVRWGGGESLADVTARTRSFLTIDSPADDEIVLVTHGDTMRVILGVLDGRSHRHLDWDLIIGNGAVMEREVDLAALRDGEYDAE